MFFAAIILVLVTRTNSQDSTTTESVVTCALFDCNPGYVCIEYPTEPRCDPIQKPGECPLTGCPVNPEQSTCSPDSCEVDFDCNGTQKCCKGCNGCGYCVDPSPPPSCKAVQCQKGYVCELQGVLCVTTPCYSRPTCVKIGQCPALKCLPVTGPPIQCSSNVTCLSDEDCEGRKKCCRDCSLCRHCTKPFIERPPSCKRVKCEPEFFCILRPVQCVTVPCYPQPTCVGRAETCSLPADPGPCDAIFPSWYYDKNSGQCKQFSYGGCDGNDNRFSTQRECERACRGI